SISLPARRPGDAAWAGRRLAATAGRTSGAARGSLRSSRPDSRSARGAARRSSPARRGTSATTTPTAAGTAVPSTGAATARPLAEPPVAGTQQPRICAFPQYAASSGAEAVELARMAKLGLDPWQELVLGHSLGERPDGSWAAFEVGLVVPRQNGKGTVLEAREL